MRIMTLWYLWRVKLGNKLQKAYKINNLSFCSEKECFSNVLGTCFLYYASMYLCTLEVLALFLASCALPHGRWSSTGHHWQVKSVLVLFQRMLIIKKITIIMIEMSFLCALSSFLRGIPPWPLHLHQTRLWDCLVAVAIRQISLMISVSHHLGEQSPRRLRSSPWRPSRKWCHWLRNTSQLWVSGVIGAGVFPVALCAVFKQRLMSVVLCLMALYRATFVVYC